MPARRREAPPTPAVQMREYLEVARGKGYGFELAWKRGLERIRWPESKATRDEWKLSLNAMLDAWKDAYLNTGTAPRGFDQLGNLFDIEASEHFPTELVA